MFIHKTLIYFIISLFIIFCSSFTTEAVAKSKSGKKLAEEYCSTWEKSHPGGVCGISQGWVCAGKDWKKLKTFKAAYTACQQVGGNKDWAKAKARCDEHNKFWEKGACTVTYPHCKVGWTKLGKYGKYLACRKLKPSGDKLYDIWQAYMKRGEGKAKVKMPRHMQAFIKKYYNVNANNIYWGPSINKYAGCMTDCTKIYCKANQNINQLIKKKENFFSRTMFHEITHVEQCRKVGGRKKYAKMWMSELPTGFFGAKNGNQRDKFMDRMHDAMPMEKKAYAKANKIWDIYQKGYYNRKWKCRIYRGNKIVWESPNTEYRIDCEQPSNKTYKAAFKAYQVKKTMKNGLYRRGTYQYVYGRKNASHAVMWSKTEK